MNTANITTIKYDGCEDFHVSEDSAFHDLWAKRFDDNGLGHANLLRWLNMAADRFAVAVIYDSTAEDVANFGDDPNNIAPNPVGVPSEVAFRYHCDPYGDEWKGLLDWIADETGWIAQDCWHTGVSEYDKHATLTSEYVSCGWRWQHLDATTIILRYDLKYNTPINIADIKAPKEELCYAA
jgi:hypothetical protein|tara:strand:- start:723 stop:1265 length:543 start_codon:yes stop_codon:yes gene_type:complete